MKSSQTWILASPQTATRSFGVMTVAALLFAVLTAMGAAFSFPLPFSPVPVTLQTLAVILAGVVLGPVWGPISQVMYIGAGMSGLPVFANGLAGPAVLVGPTGGYLAGFVLGAWAAGLLARPGSSWVRLGVSLLLAHTVIFVFGVAQLKLYTGNSFAVAFQTGVAPFLPGMVFKTAVAVALLRSRRFGWFRS